jgi:hypothetical protein
MNHISQNMDFKKEMAVSVIEASRIRPNENLLEKPGGQVFETSNIS